MADFKGFLIDYTTHVFWQIFLLKNFNNLYKIGYRYFKLKQISKNDKKVISAFQHKYLPKKVNGKIDKECLFISISIKKINKDWKSF